MKLKILGKLYTVNIVSVNSLPNDYGECNNEHQTIKVREDIHPENQADVLLHEVFHAIDSGMNLKLTERHVHGMATGLLAVIYDNPDFMEWLCQKKSTATD